MKLKDRDVPAVVTYIIAGTAFVALAAVAMLLAGGTAYAELNNCEIDIRDDQDPPVVVECFCGKAVYHSGPHASKPSTASRPMQGCHPLAFRFLFVSPPMHLLRD